MSSVVGSGMAKSLLGSVEEMRRPELADLLLLATVTLWALNFTVTKYVISHGFAPIAYSCFRFGGAGILFAALTWARERSFAVRRSDLPMLVSAALIGIFLNQLAFSYAIKLTTATTVALLFGTLPVLTGLFAWALGIERFGSRFWVAATLAFGGAALVALGSGGGFSGQLWGDLLGLVASATWAWYTVAVSPLLQRYSTLRISSLAFAMGTVPLVLVGSQQLLNQDYGSVGARVWLSLAFAIVGPLVVANLLWFGAISRVGPSRASVFANLQPFLAAFFSLLILDESMTRVQIVGGIAIAGGILLSRSSRRLTVDTVTA
jgi:drug/metabolite transporter (DMT)-like permease